MPATMPERRKARDVSKTSMEPGPAFRRRPSKLTGWSTRRLVCRTASRRRIHHPGRSPFGSGPWASKLVSGGTKNGSIPRCPIRGAVGAWGAGPILIAACRHSRERQTRPPRVASGVRRPRVQRGDRLSPVSGNLSSLPLFQFVRSLRHRGQAAAVRAPAGNSPVST